MAGERDDFEIARVAALARLRLTPEETALYGAQLGDILDFVRQLQDADTADVPPGGGVLPADAGRPDAVRPSLRPEDVLANAPDSTADPALIRVPKVLG